MTRALTLVLTTSLLAAGREGGRMDQPSERPQSSAAGGTARGPAVSVFTSLRSPIDPCALLTAAEVAVWIPRAKSSRATDRTSGAQICAWKPANAVLPRLEVVVAPHDRAFKAGGLDLLRGIWHQEAPDHHGQYVENLGDATVVESGIVGRDDGETEVRTYIGDTLVRVQLTIAPGNSWARTLDSAVAKQAPLVALARGVIRRLR
jgi:hypothetical protein